MGAPKNASFQKKVILAALALFKNEQGPVLEYFEHESPDTEVENEAVMWSCPISFSQPAPPGTGKEKQVSAFREEVMELMPWFDLSMENRGRTPMSTFEPYPAAEILCNYLLDKSPEIPQPDLSIAVAIRLAVQDLESFYYEAITSMPGMKPTSKAFADWFWTQTVAGKIIKEIKEKCIRENDEELQVTGKRFLVPMGR